MKYRHVERLTNFLDPREREIMRSVIGNDDELNIRFFGGASFTERSRAFLVPSYIEITDEDFQLVLFSVDYPRKFFTLTHRDMLGAMMNLGIQREKFGDIVYNDSQFQIVVAEEIASFVELNLSKVGKATVKLERLPLHKLIQKEENWVSMISTVTSLRLDAVLGQIFSLSRSKVVPFIEKGLVKVNWKVVDRPDFIVEVGDYLSMRQFGRARIVELLGQSRKNKIRFRYEQLK